MVIVTIKFPALGNKSYDVEVPTTIPTSALVIHIAETINSYTQNYSISSQGMCLESKRLKRVLLYDETFETAGIWNGDYLIYRSV